MQLLTVNNRYPRLKTNTTNDLSNMFSISFVSSCVRRNNVTFWDVTNSEIIKKRVPNTSDGQGEPQIEINRDEKRCRTRVITLCRHRNGISSTHP